jgi:YHS domain-containing protein/thiol-disulfide isomerase/thioredoxin
MAADRADVAGMPPATSRLGNEASTMRTMVIACQAAVLWGVFTATASAQQDIPWASDLESAKQAAAASNRLVLMHFTASWCKPCKLLEQNVFIGQPEVAQAVASQYVAVKMDFDRDKAIARQYGVRYIPWDVIVTPEGYWVADFNSPRTPSDYVAKVNQIAGLEAAKRNGLYAGQPGQAPSAPAPPTSIAVDAVAGPQENSSPRLSDDRYAQFFAGSQQPAPRLDPVAPPYAQQMPNLGGPGLNPPAMPLGAAPSGPLQPPEQPQPSSSAPPSGHPTFALDGHCPVHLLEQSAWVSGDRRWGAHHRGQTYLFVSEGCQKKFMANPDRYAPALSGQDPVALVDRGQSVAGRREHGCFFGAEPNRRVVLFANEASFEAFKNNPQRYAGQILATR